jgi:hypothetical protein
MNAREDRHDELPPLGTAGLVPAKFIQICASQDDLFALDGEGNIFQYNFKTKAWGRLVAGRASERRAPQV